MTEVRATPTTFHTVQLSSSRRPWRAKLCWAAFSFIGVLTIVSPAPALAANADDATSAPSDAALLHASRGLRSGPLASLPIEVIDARHRLQVLPTLGAVVSRLADRKVYCRDMPINDMLHNIRCTQTDPHEGVADFAMLTKVENGRLLVVSTFDAVGTSIDGKPALDTIYLAATGGSAPAEVTDVGAVKSESAPTVPPAGSSADVSDQRPAQKDYCLWTSVKGQKVDMGSLAGLDAFTHQIGGQCFIRTGAEEHATITCRFPDSRTHRTHELVLEGDGDDADCYGITHTALDGRTLPYTQYVRVFVDHK